MQHQHLHLHLGIQFQLVLLQRRSIMTAQGAVNQLCCRWHCRMRFLSMAPTQRLTAGDCTFCCVNEDIPHISEGPRRLPGACAQILPQKMERLQLKLRGCWGWLLREAVHSLRVWMPYTKWGAELVWVRSIGMSRAAKKVARPPSAGDISTGTNQAHGLTW